MNPKREREFAKIFTSKMHKGNLVPIDERMNAVGRLLTELYNRTRELKDKIQCPHCGA